MRASVYWNHFKTICLHKKWVAYYCNICGLKWRGFKHDLSKFSPKEFREYAKYYAGTKSPIDTCKEQNGYSLAWLHHKGKNDHHFEYWIDYKDNVAIPLKMPFECATEMICDYLGAGIAYAKNAGQTFSYKQELDWFINKINNGCLMHKDIIKYVYLVLRNLSYLDQDPNFEKNKNKKYVLHSKYLNLDSLQRLYDYASSLSDEKFELIRKSTEKKEEVE